MTTDVLAEEGPSLGRLVDTLRRATEGRLVTEFHDWDDLRAELHDEALAAERDRTEAWVSAFHLAEKRKSVSD